MLSVEFDKRIFKMKAVKAAVKDYKGFADFKLVNGDGGIVVEIDNIDYESEDDFLGEFGNYVIHKMSVI